MSRKYVKQLADPLYGTIGLTNIEVEVIGTRAFQRLTNIEQLGVVHHVFPGASYSRFAHSIGVCHVAGQILDALAQSGHWISDEDWQRYRLAALLHDVGHYPFSHAFENALKGSELGTHLEHETVGAMVIKHDPELSGVLKPAYDPVSISAIFNRYELPGIDTTLQDVISSGIDADRLDYLRRTAHYSGVPYGSVDGDYLTSQFRTDDDGNVCITTRARLTADHFLLSRWFEYQQIIYHHTVQAADTILEDVLIELIGQNEAFHCTPSNVREKIKEGNWASFDDTTALTGIRDLAKETKDDVLQEKCRALLERRLPKTIFEHSRFRERENKGTRSSDEPLEDGALDALAKQFNLERDRWYLKPKSVPFTKMWPDGKRTRKGKHDVRIGEPVRTNGITTPTSTLIADDHQAVMSLLAEKERYTWRLFVFFPLDWDETKVEETRSEIRDTLFSQYISDDELQHIKST